MQVPSTSQLKPGSSGVSIPSARLLARASRAFLMQVHPGFVTICAAFPDDWRSDPGSQIRDRVEAGVDGQVGARACPPRIFEPYPETSQAPILG
eukprot:9233034-Pyramimonas_sp.AAC.1